MLASEPVDGWAYSLLGRFTALRTGTVNLIFDPIDLHRNNLGTSYPTRLPAPDYRQDGTQCPTTI